MRAEENLTQSVSPMGHTLQDPLGNGDDLVVMISHHQAHYKVKLLFKRIEGRKSEPYYLDDV